MNEYSSKQVILDDISIDIHHNPMLTSKPYFLKIYGYDGYTEHRLDSKDLLNLAEQLSDFVFDNPNSTGYAENYTGLVRLYHHRRNEALNIIEKLENRLDFND
jgi:hypothetical protein